jgi:hypothetical protein
VVFSQADLFFAGGIFAADRLSGPPAKMDFHRWAVGFTLIYIFVGGYLAPKIMSAYENKYPTSAKMFF